MRDHYERPGVLERFPDQIFEERDRGDVEVVRRLIKQQQVRFLSEHERDGGLLPFTAGSGFGIRARADIQPLQIGVELRDLFPVEFVVRWIKAGLRDQALTDRGSRREDRFLLKKHNPQTVLHLNLSVIQRGLTGENLKHGALACAVATDETDTLTLLNRKIRVVEKRVVTESEARVF